MKQKLKQIYTSVLQPSLFLVVIASLVVMAFPTDGLVKLFVNTASANAICSGASVDLTLLDVTTGQNLGTYSNDGSQIDISEYNITLTYGHIIKYTMGGGGTPSFTEGISYFTADGYSYSEHTWSPNPSPGFNGAFTSPPVQSNGRVVASRHENNCTPGPGFPGDVGATVGINFTTTGGPASPSMRTGTTNLAVFGTPAVTLSINGASGGSFKQGDTATMTWVSQNVNNGDSCTASNVDNSGGKGSTVDPSWDGVKNGPGGGTQDLDPFSSTGTFTYSIICYGFNGIASVPASVSVSVGNPSYTCSASPASLAVYAGSDTSTVITTSTNDGYSNPVTFTDSIDPIASNPPTISYGKTNGQVPPADTTATISTNGLTSTGLYQITFTGDGGVSCSVFLNVLSLTPSGTISCDTQPAGTACDIGYGGTSTIKWDSSNVSSCNVYQSPDFTNPWATGLSNLAGKLTGALYSTTTYSLHCTGPYGSIDRQVVVNVAAQAPGAPNLAQSLNTPCGTLKVAWTAGSPTPPTTTFQVWKRTTPVGKWTAYGPVINAGGTYEVTDINPNGLANYYKVTATNGVSVDSNQVGPLVPVNCAPSLEGSYKRIVGVGNAVPSFTRCGSSGGFTLPNNLIYKAGDKVYFEICIINSGTSTLSSVKATENLTTSQYIENVNYVNSGSNCASETKTQGYSLGTMTPNQACSILVSATISNPGGPASDLYRFWNAVDVTSDLVSKSLYSPKTAFSVGAGAPTRNESAP